MRTPGKNAFYHQHLSEQTSKWYNVKHDTFLQILKQDFVFIYILYGFKIIKEGKSQKFGNPVSWHFVTNYLVTPLAQKYSLASLRVWHVLRCHTFSIILKSGDCGGHSTFIPLARRHFTVDFEECFGSSSRWNTQPLLTFNVWTGDVPEPEPEPESTNDATETDIYSTPSYSLLFGGNKRHD